jgi:tetratricopeptide (TPR) repeat protein
MSADGATQAAALRERGNTLLDLGRPVDALTVLGKSLQLDPDAFETHCLLALALRRLGRADESLQLIEDGLRRHPNEEWLHRLRSQAFDLRGDYPAALESAREAHRLRPDVWQTGNQLVDVLIHLRLIDEAADAARRLVELAPTEACAVNQLGRIALMRRQLLEAEVQFRHALRLDPTCAVYHDNVGITLYQQGRMDAATRCFDAAAAVDPTYKSAQANLYESSRMLRKQSLLTGSRQLLARISPRTYQYYLHREGETFGMFSWMYVLKGWLPLAMLLVSGNGLLRLLGKGIATTDMVMWSVLLGIVGFVLVTLVLPRGSWRRWFEPSARQVAVVATISPVIFNPLLPLVAGAGGMMSKKGIWEFWLILLIVGMVLTGRALKPRVRGWSYTLASRFYASWLRGRAQFDAFLRDSRFGPATGGLLRAVRHPLLWLAVALAGGVFSENEILRPIWGLAILMATLMTALWLLKLSRAPLLRLIRAVVAAGRNRTG